jgi:glutathione S-transferase
VNEIKVWGRANSINVQKVLWTLEELSIPFKRIDAGLDFGVNKSAQYLALNPNGLVPTIDDQGYILWESQAIMRYLVRKSAANQGNSSLYPQQAGAVGLVDQWLEWNSTVIWPAMRPLFWGWVRLKPEERDTQALEQSRLLMIKNLTMLEHRLERSRYVAGEEFTLADIPLALIAYRWFNIPITRPDFEHVNRWYSLVCARAGFVKHCSSPLT